MPGSLEAEAEDEEVHELEFAIRDIGEGRIDAMFSTVG